ncbi:hypothetical protein ACSETL_34380, partial [Pseudomonas aeruginosa]
GISGRIRVEWVAGSPWNRWSDAYGMGGQMTVESAFDLVVDQFIPEIGATQLATSGTGAAVNGGESTIFWTAAGKKYTLETRLVSLD